MTYATVCSGIEAPSVSWEQFGWKLAWVSEIEPYCCHLLAHRYGASRPQAMPDPEEPGLSEETARFRRAAAKAVSGLPEDGRIPNFGDFTTVAERILSGEAEAPDILIGGTPCQAFSVAGRRLSLADARGNLTLSFILLCDAIDTVRSRNGQRPLTVVWENVPGVLSTKDNAFGSFLAGLAGEDGALRPPGGRWTDAGYVSGPQRAAAWRTFDAQYFGLAQRRERVFAVASVGAVCPAAVLFEFGGLRRDTPPRRKAGQGTAGYSPQSIGGYREGAGPLRSSGGDVRIGSDVLVTGAVTKKWSKGTGGPSGDECQNLVVQETAPTLGRKSYRPDECTPAQIEGFCIPVAYDTTQITSPDNSANPAPDGPCHTLQRNQHPPLLAFRHQQSASDTGVPQEDVAPTLRTSDGSGIAVSFRAAGQEGLTPSDIAPPVCSTAGGGAGVPVAFHQSGSGDVRTGETAYTLNRNAHATGRNAPLVRTSAVRRLTPTECERLQGFPDGHTAVPYRGKPAADTPRYQALGNSMAVNVVRWIGRRIHDNLNT